MEGCEKDAGPPIAGDEEKLKDIESAGNFQRFVYDLFEKNGILNDLRAYLRGHIVDVLKSAQTGEPPTCQKHFTQRLELNYQALNMLIAEYLLRLEFTYSLSVFVSEIPLANMVFGFAKNLMLNNNGDFEDLRFKDNDVWSILNYLGVKCDSEHASRVVEMYNTDGNLPLLLCILKCMPLYQQETCFEERPISSSESLSSAKSLNLHEEKNIRSTSKVGSHEKCRHHVFCKTCQARVTRLKEKYRAKKKYLIKRVKSSEVNPLNVESFMRNIGLMERNLVDEMFQQLKSVYEAEVEMMKQDEEKKIKRSLASHALQLQKRRDEMEESFKAREEELERNVQEKKKFLWGLARALRDQHAVMTRAMTAVQCETDRLEAKEDSLKSQLLEAEEVLRKRGEEMRQQISNELVILEGHLESMKRERESISRQREELENLKVACNSSIIKVHDLNNEELRSHYDLLRNELGILKKYLETTKLEAKCVIERGTITDLSDVTSKIHVALNNMQDADRVPQNTDSEERRTPNKVVNDLKKQKNVNFSASNVEELYREGTPCRSRVWESSDVDHTDRQASRESLMLDQLRDENERLKMIARQQREYIDELSSTITRPRTAPATVYPHYTQPCFRLNTSASVSSVGWRKGAGEEISVFSNARPRILLPGDNLPFIGMMMPRDRHSDSRRYLINQWRALRRRVSPLRPSRPLLSSTRIEAENPTIASPSQPEVNEMVPPRPNLNETFTFKAVPRERPKTAIPQVRETQQTREKSPKSVLREAKEKLRNKPPSKASTSAKREKSPDSVLREAKLRLRKLEIEAEAVERSYLEFRRSKPENTRVPPATHITDPLDIPRMSHHSISENYRVENITYFNKTPEAASTKHDFEKYLCEYQTKFPNTSHFENNTSQRKKKPIPEAYCKIEAKQDESHRENYLETPLIEFRKLYTTPSPTIPINLSVTEKLDTPNRSSDKNATEMRSKPMRGLKSKKDELEILKDNISKMYNLQDHHEIEQKIEGTIVKIDTPRNHNLIDEIKKKIETAIVNNDTSRSENIIVNIEQKIEESIVKNRSPRINDNLVSEIKRKIQEANVKTDTPRKENLVVEIEEKTERAIVSNNSPKKDNLISEIEQMIERSIVKTDSPKDKNLKIEVENVSESNSLKVTEETMGELLLVVESSIDARELEAARSEQEHMISTHMTVVVSPKRNSPDGAKEVDESIRSIRCGRSMSPEQAARLTRNDVLDAIFQSDVSKQPSSVEMDINASKEVLEAEEIDSSDGAKDYPDDFSADVDNYNSRSDYDNDHSPISLAKNSEDDNFWDT